MKMFCRAAGVAAVGLLLSACGRSPAGAAMEAAGPSYDGGFGMGSGNREAPADSTMDSATSTDSTGRGGFTIGSGN